MWSGKDSSSRVLILPREHINLHMSQGFPLKQSQFLPLSCHTNFLSTEKLKNWEKKKKNSESDLETTDMVSDYKIVLSLNAIHREVKQNVYDLSNHFYVLIYSDWPTEKSFYPVGEIKSAILITGVCSASRLCVLNTKSEKKVYDWFIF